jgi:protein required for attachment to host cells
MMFVGLDLLILSRWRIPAMSKQQNLLVVVADGEHARFLRPAANNALHCESAFDSTAAHQQSSDLGTDHPGAAMHTGSTAHHALAPRHDLKDLEKAKFARCIAQQINTAAMGEGFDRLILVAPSHILAAVYASLDTESKAFTINTLAKDLTKVPDDELWPHVQAWVPRAQRSAFIGS